ncbi:AraC family transcriptional regulator [Bordetella pertussis]|uniref:AraC-family transcriptional regulator n=1 Tax=Bordetella pertussis (strain ATCC 9797 / DSM 5571 / CCUG 30873 / LMG 14455 / NCTC 10739 / 18323) TaxID=568706 RepID=A0A0T7CKN8_BORP1|nr:AraC family transcriptional regulator [Bordetella pertussis]AZR83847.1 AraC family transcriptional regulator [Bordetella pertussis]PNO99901.1 AraC family transcriptional regulator [Bordetella pertussis 18323]UEB59894.1 AraC family transcriptional regulator [Bordetella pertussis]CCJ62045.1 AraC-family transcriptional regulator [Bordetella pertussis 18323]CFP44350.1 AraC family transcriptional regulator [Bordetella pertussis]
MKPKTRLYYAERLEPVLAWLAARPDADADLHRLAKLACLSPYYFHRVYRALLGETVHATVQRMRLARASVALAQGKGSLRQVADRAGYASEAAFSRAFSAQYGLPPGRYRAKRSSPFNPEELRMYPLTMEDFPGLSLAILAHQGDYQEIGNTFDRLALLAAIQDLVRDGMQPPPRYIGVYYDDPAQVARDALRSRAGVSLPPGTAAPAPFEPLDIPAMRCAVLEYTGPYSEIEAPYNWLFSQWLPASGQEPGDFPMFEEYLNDPKTTPAAQLKTRIYLPLA